MAACAALGTALLLVTCTGEPVAPGAPRVGQISIAPIWPEASRLGGLVLDNVRLTVVRLPADTVARTARTFSPTTTQLQLNIPVLLQGPSEQLQVTLELFSGTTLLFSGTQLLTVGAGASTSPVQLPVTFSGPGGQVASLALQPRDTTIGAGAQLAFTVTAQDSQQAPVAQFYTTWSSSSSAVTIDAAGVATAGSGRATVTITAVTPSGARDSTTLTVAPPASQIVKVSGDNQAGTILAPLPQPLVVEARAADNLPVPGVVVSFTALSGGGSVDSATVTTDSLGRASTLVTLGGTAGAQSFTASAAGTNTLTFTATASGGGVRVWNGSVDDQWTTAGNWAPAAVPAAGDSVEIVAGTPNDPTLTGNASIAALALSGNNSALFLTGNLTVARGIALPDSNSFVELNSGLLTAGSATLAGFQAFIDASGGSAIIGGAVALSGDRSFVDAGPGSALGATTLSGSQTFLSHAGGTQGPITASGSSAFWEGSGAVTVTGAPAIQLTGSSFVTSFGSPTTVTINGDVTVGGTAAFVDPRGGDHFTINGNLQTTGGGYLQMTQATDTIEVNGNITFGGGDESTRLTNGMLFVSGNFSQTGAGSTFIGSGGHTVFLDGGAAQTINFAAPGFAAGRFQNVIVANSVGGVTATSNLFATGTAGVTPTAVRTLSGNGSTLFTTILNVSNFTFNNLLLNFAGSTVVTFDTVTFQGYAATATPLTISHPGAAFPLPFVDVTFTVVPTTGFYLSATDTSPSDGVPLVIDMANPAPLTPGSFVQTAGGATVNWPSNVAPGTWTGTVDTSWNTAANWSDGNVPTATTDVIIPAGTPFAPFTSGSVRQTRNLTVQSGATLTLSGGSLAVTGSLDAPGLITGNVVGLSLTGTGTLQGNLSGTFFNPTISGSYSLGGRLVATSLTINGSLNLAGHTAVVGAAGTGNNFQTSNFGILIMQSPLDSLLVVGGNPAVNFSGGSTAGQLTNGVIALTNSGFATFTQDNTFSDSSYAPSGSHTVVFATATTISLSFATPGTGSHFNNLDISAQTPGFSLATPVRVNGTFRSTPASTAPAINGGNRLFTAAGPVNVTGLTLTNAPFALLGDNAVVFDNVTLQGFINSVTQLSISGTGAGGPLTLNNLLFSTVPSTGFYLGATDTDGATPNALTVNLVNPAPATPGSFVLPANGAVINWPAGSPVKTWTGAATSDWQTTTNWSPAGIPVATDDVIIPAVATQPVMSAAVSLHNLTVQSGALPNLNSFALNVSGNVVAPSATSFIGGGGTLNLTGAGATISGNLSTALPVAVTGSYSLAGRTVIGNLTISASGNVTLGGQTLVVGSALNTTGSGTLTMTSSIDSVLVTGAGIFGGGSTSGLLTAGYLKIGGSFTQTSATSTTSFAASGTHRTELGAAAVRIVNFATPAVASSHFNDLIVTPATGGLSLAANTFVNGQLISHPTGATPLIGVTAGPRVLTVGGVDVSRLTIDQNVMTIGAGVLTQFDTVSFTGQANGVTQLTIDNPGPVAPLSFTALSFAVTPVGGHYITANDADAVSPFLTLNIASASPAAPSASLFTATNGAILNWPAASPVVTWTGAVSTNWSVAGNWSPAQIPTNADDVVIPATTNKPVITTSCSAKSILVQSGGLLDLGAFNCQVQGGVNVGGTTAGTGAFQIQAPGQVQGNLRGLIISAPVSLSSIASIIGNLVITGAGASFDVNGFNAVVSGNLAVQGAGLLIMQDANDALTIQGDAVFDGGNELGQLSAGSLLIGGNFTQSQTSSGDSFHPSGTHQTGFFGASPTLVFATAGNVPGTSHFEEVSWSGNGTMTLLSDVFAHGTMSGAPGVTGTIASSNHTLQVGDFVSGGATFDGTSLVLDQPLGAAIALDNVSFINMSSTVDQLTVNHPGTGGPFTFSNLTFSTTPTAGAVYLAATDIDAGANGFLTIDVVNATPATPGPFTQANNGASINWPVGGSPISWTGTADANWFNPSNWSSASVPGIADTAIILSGTPFGPVLNSGALVGALTVQASALLDLDAFVMVVNGTVDNGGLISSVTNGGVALTGTGALLRGIFNTDVSINGTYVLNGGVSAGNFSIANGNLDVGGRTLSVSTFSTLGSGVVQMTGALDSVLVGTFAIFQGGSTFGLLTNGVLSVGGDFLQDATNSTTSFAPSGTHKTLLTGRSPASIIFFSPGQGSGGSHFQVLDVSGATAGYTLSVNSIADSLISTSASATLLGNGNSLTVRRVQVSGLTLDDLPLVLDEQGVGAGEVFDNVTFQNNTTTTLLTVVAPGSALANRPIQFNNTTVPLGGTNLYVELTSSNGLGVTLTMNGSNNPTGGPSRSNPSFGSVVNGARILWQ